MSADHPQLSAPQPPRLVAGRYRLGARRGASADSALFEAFDEELHRPVIVKMVHPEISARPEVQERFRAAMELAGSLHHPNIAVAYTWGITEFNGHRVLYVVSEQLTGGSLRDVLDRGRLLSASQAILVGLDACKALDVLHRRGLVHGDIRPSTLVFGDDRRLRVVDAGLSQVLAEASGGPAHRSNDVAKYTSPEQAVGQPLEARSDVYSLCLTLLETLTGSVPFVGDSTVATLGNRVDKLLPVSADLGPLASVLERAARPSPRDRYGAAEFGRALVQSAERLPRPEPLPILANSLFGADPGSPSEPVDPTGPLLASSLASASSVASTVPSVVSALPPPAPPQSPRPVGSSARLEPPTAVMPSTSPGLTSPGVMTTTSVDAVDPDFDPRDEFPEPPAPPSTGRRWLIAVLLVMALAGGALAWYYAQPQTRTVPDVVGMEQGVALNAIAGDFKGTTAQEASETVGVGLVIRTAPPVGSAVEKNSAITLFVSTGPAPRVLPELAGLAVDVASAKLQQLGLTVEVADGVFDEKVPLNTVMKWSVPDSPTLLAGANVTKGTAVRLVPSKGPAPRTVPDLTAKTLAEATTTLTDLGLVDNQGADEFSATVPVGQIARQDPAAGSTAPKGGTVIVFPSKGPELLPIPSIAGLNIPDIEAALVAAGFVVGPPVGNPGLAFIGLQVNGQPAAEGATFPRGTVVNLTYAPA